MYEKELMPSAQSMGDDHKFCVTRDVQCYAIDDSPNNNNLDELSVGASIIIGRLTKGENVWRNEEGISVKKTKAVQTFDVIDEMDVNNHRYEEAASTIFQMLHNGKDDLIRMLSYAYHLNMMLGGQNEDLFTVPRQIDRGGMTKLGFECVETEAYDLVVPGEQRYTASDKTKKGCFHTGKKQTARADHVAGTLDMKNIRAGQSSDNMTRPQFDSLILMQYNPFLVCGVAPYSKVVHHIRQKGDGGIILTKIPIDNFRYVISPTEYYPPEEIPSVDHETLEKFVDDVRGGIFRKLLDKPLTIVDTSIPQSEIW